MKLTKSTYIKLAVISSFILSMGAISFAGNTISDVPLSPNETRTIKWETTPYTDSCDITQEMGFYDKSPVYLRVGQPKGPVSYVFDKSETYVRVYNQPLFDGNLKFPYVANFVASTVLEQDTSNIFTVEATGAKFKAVETMERNQIAGQIVTKNMERSIFNNANGATLNYYYKLANINFTPKNGTVKIIINTQVTPKTSCTSYYVARCGDGIIDKATGSSDGKGGITTQGGVFLAWHPRSIKPNEICDDGALNGTPGKCKTDCTGLGTGTPNGPSCTLTSNSATIESGQQVTLTASYTSGTSATFTPSISGLTTFTYPERNGTATANPTSTTTYSLTVQGATGTTPAVCSTTVTLAAPTLHLGCTINFSPSTIVPNQVVSVGWNVQNGNFFGTYIYVAPALVGARPHRINANEYNGVTTAMPTQAGDYVFTMSVNNNLEAASCTGVLHVIDNVPPSCVLTTTTPSIMPGQTALLNASYTNAVGATFTPNISGLNLNYPTRSNPAIAVSPTTTTTYILNTVNSFGSGATCTTTINVVNTGLTLSKTLVNDILYRSGDLVSFKINFANQGPSTVNNVVLSDYLPVGLEYVSSQLFGVSPYQLGTGANGGNQFVEYSGFSLTPGQQGYMLIVGRFKGPRYANQTLNNSFLRSDNSPTIYASALFYAYAPDGNAVITKIANKISYFPGEDAKFTIAVTNNGPDAINDISITDDWPNTSCVTPDSQWTSNMPLTMTNTNDPYTWRYNGSLAVGQTIYLYITGHISNSLSCVGTYINDANLSYVANGITKTGNAQSLTFVVSTTPSSTMNFEKKLIQYGNNVGDPVIFELIYQNNGTATITNYDVVDYWPGTLHFVSATPMPATQTPTVGGSLLRWVMNTPLAPNGSGKIIINGTIK